MHKNSERPPLGELTFVTQVGGGSEWDNFRKSRNIVRAHVMRKHWQEFKNYDQPDQSSTTSPKADWRRTSKDSDVPIRKRPYKSDSRKGHRPLAPRIPAERLCHPFWKASDPFFYAGSSVDPKSARLFSYYGAEVKMLLSNHMQPLRIEGPPACCIAAIHKNSAVLLNAICFQAAARIAVLETALPLRTTLFDRARALHETEKDTYHYRAATLGGLSRVILNAETNLAVLETSILCVVILLNSDSMMGHINHAELHTHGLRHLVKAAGGLQALSSSTISPLQLADVKAAIAQRRLPSFELQSHVRDRAETLSRLAISTASEAFMGFLEPSMQIRLCPAFFKCISFTRYLMLAKSKTERDWKLPDPPQLDDFIALEHSLVSLRGDPHLNALEECMRLALLIFSNTALWRIPPYIKWIASLVTELKAAIILVEWEPSTNEAGILLWVSFLGRYAVKFSDSAERRWWSNRVLDAAVRAKVTSWKDTKSLMCTFAYVDEIYGLAWEEIWEEADFGLALSRGRCSNKDFGATVGIEGGEIGKNSDTLSKKPL